MRDLGIGIGAGVTSAIKTYGEMMNIISQQRQMNKENAEADASANVQDQSTPVEGSADQIVKNFSGGPDGKADPEAVLQTYGGIQSASTPQQAQGIYQQGQQMASQANAAATPSMQVPNPQVAPQAAPNAPVAPVPPTAGAPAPTTAAAPGTSAVQPGGIGAPAPVGPPAAAQSMGPDYAVGRALGAIENSNKPLAVDPKSGAVNGIMPATWAAYAQNGESKTNPADVAAVKSRILGDLHDQFNGDPNKMAVAWFSGPKNVNTDPNADTPYKNGDLKDANGVTVKQYVNTFQQKLGTLNTINSHGGTEVPNAAGDGSTPPVHPDTKVTDITAKALPSGAVDDHYTFQQGPNGQMTMTKAASASDRAMAAAQKAYQVGDLKNAGPLMQAAMTMRQQESAQSVTKIMTDPNMSQDEKVGALAKMAGATAYKTENGSYIVPGLGPTDGVGRPAPMNYQQVAALSTFMTTPEGMQHALDYNIQQQKMGVEQQNANSSTASAAAATANAGVNQQKATSEISKNNMEGQYYGAFKTAQTEAAKSSAAERNSKAQLQSEMSALEKQQQALDPNDPQYAQKSQQLQTAHAMLVSRQSGTAMKAPNPQKMEPNTPYRMPDGTVKMLNQTGAMMDPQASTTADVILSKMRADPDKYQGMMLDTDGKVPTVAIGPVLAKQYGLDPNARYATPEAAQSAIVKSKIFQTQNPSLVHSAANAVTSGDAQSTQFSPQGATGIPTVGM